MVLNGQTIHFESSIRKFMIHEPSFIGEWQSAREESGPQKGGIYGELELRPGNYRGQVLVPQAFDKRYFTLPLMAPYAVMLDHHLYVHLRYPRDVSPEFLEDFQRLVNQFGKLALAQSAHRPPNERLQRKRPASSSPA